MSVFLQNSSTNFAFPSPLSCVRLVILLVNFIDALPAGFVNKKTQVVNNCQRYLYNSKLVTGYVAATQLLPALSWICTYFFK